MRRFMGLVLLVVVPIVTACVWIVQSGSIEEILPQNVGTPRRVESPMKAFLLDGSTVVYRDGGTITPDSVQGEGVRYAVGTLQPTPVSSVALDSVVGIEAFQGRVNAGTSFVLSLGATALGAIGTALLAVAIFGSCPTFYASPQQGGLLQAEAFSYSVAPLMEARDLDAMRIRPDSDGVVRLELRNEALETHYINQLELVAADHAPDVRALSDDHGVPIGVANEVGPREALDRDGTDVLGSLQHEDGLSFASSEERIRSASGLDDRDFIDLTFDTPEGDEAVIVLSLRNSLLTTVLFYDMMLGRAGAGAVDWLGRDMARVGSVLELGLWFRGAMGLRVQVPSGEEWVDVGRVPDTGPIAWEEVGVRVPVPESGPLRVRLSFFTDAWRIDRVALGARGELTRTTHVGPARLIEDGVAAPTETIQLLAKADDRYLATYPGTSAMLEFSPPPPGPGLTRSYLLGSQGYYSEWIRSDWIRNAEEAVTFRPGDDTVETLMQLWLSKKDAFEADFYSSRIPVR
jgi:hypothetical protein